MQNFQKQDIPPIEAGNYLKNNNNNKKNRNRHSDISSSQTSSPAQFFPETEWEQLDSKMCRNYFLNITDNNCWLFLRACSETH